MYETGVNMRMVSRHRLPEGSPGEQEEHSHSYQVEIITQGSAVDYKGYLVDIGTLKEALSEVLDLYRGRCMNELADFSSSVPSLENLAQAICARITMKMDAPLVERIIVKVWEDEAAWASYWQGIGR